MRPFVHISFLLLISVNSFGQIENGFYRGFERMCWKDKKGDVQCYGAPEKWYHENLLYIENDSAFLYKSPVHFVGKRKLYSSSDGGFYYWLGLISKQINNSKIIFFNNECDYCGKLSKIDSITGFIYPIIDTATKSVFLTKEGYQIDDVLYKKINYSFKDFPSKRRFCFDSNSIYRVNPKNQYNLIATGIKYFFKTGDLKTDNDTLRICVERFENDSLLEALNPDKIKIDTTGITFLYYTTQELKRLVSATKKPIRYIKVDEIVDYWKSARISLAYTIGLPEGIRNFSDKEYFNSFRLNKVGNDYVLDGKLPQNDWALIEK